MESTGNCTRPANVVFSPAMGNFSTAACWRILAILAPLALAPARGEAAPSGGACAGACHEKVAVDSRHREKGVTCERCHPNVRDGQADHKGATDKVSPRETCGAAGCHAEQAAKHAEGPHRDLPCSTCHGEVHGGFKHADYEACSDCHGDESQALAASVHGSKAKKPVVCADCHGDIHQPASKKDPASGFKVIQVGNCTECHDQEHVRAYRQSVHGQGVLKSGLAVAPACGDCHGSHDIVPVKSPDSKVSRKNVVATCGGCHGLIAARWKGSSHGRRWLAEQAAADGKGLGLTAAASMDGNGLPHPSEAPVCTTCHDGHRTVDPQVYGNHLKMADRCGACHKGESESYRNSFHGKATRLGYQVAATCANCHTPHEMLPKDDARSSVNPHNLEATCGQCHQTSNASFVQFDVHMDPRDKHRSPMIRTVWIFMTALLLSVLVFFATHSLLWLQRSIVALRRKELHRPPPGEQWVRRFRGTHVRIHVLVVVTFLLLAATGLPLKFSGVGWASGIEAIFGGLRSARWLHRIAGVLTFGYATAFLAYLIREIGLRRRTELLWGWQSMVPNRKDLSDLIQNLKYFLYLGPPPKLDRWAYWEKFDFFAVFWGIPVIGLSGLVLWMPGLATHILPGSAINVAYLIHGDEALLATGFIFYFHFFHTHLRPEAFPLDTVIFLGGMPLGRFQEERPAEYRRLRESGELESRLMPAPTERQMERARRFGAAALAVGVILGAFLIVAGVKAALR